MMRSNQKMHSKEIPLVWDDRPYEAEQKQQIKIRSLTPDHFWGNNTYMLIKDLPDYSVILYLPYECDEKTIEYHAKELLNRNCRDIARCSVQNDGWRYAIEDLSDIKCVYFLQDEERLFENQKDHRRQGG